MIQKRFNSFKDLVDGRLNLSSCKTNCVNTCLAGISTSDYLLGAVSCIEQTCACHPVADDVQLISLTESCDYGCHKECLHEFKFDIMHEDFAPCVQLKCNCTAKAIKILPYCDSTCKRACNKIPFTRAVETHACLGHCGCIKKSGEALVFMGKYYS
jgi:hypothetical protein